MTYNTAHYQAVWQYALYPSSLALPVIYSTHYSPRSRGETWAAGTRQRSEISCSGRPRVGLRCRKIQLFSNYSHVEQHPRQAGENQVFRWDYFLCCSARAAGTLKLPPLEGRVVTRPGCCPCSNYSELLGEQTRGGYVFWVCSLSDSTRHM